MQIVNWNETLTGSQPSLNQWMPVVYSACLALLSIEGWTKKKSNIVYHSKSFHDPLYVVSNVHKISWNSPHVYGYVYV